MAGIPICVLLVVLVVLVLFLFRSGIHVSIQNTGNQPLRSVVLFVTGTSYNLGDIPPLGSYQEGLYMTRFDDSFFLTPKEYEKIAGSHIRP